MEEKYMRGDPAKEARLMRAFKLESDYRLVWHGEDDGYEVGNQIHSMGMFSSLNDVTEWLDQMGNVLRRLRRLR